MTLRDVTQFVRRGWWLVLICAVAGTVLGVGYAQSRPLVYTATAQSYVVVNNSGTSGGDMYNSVQAAQARMATYAELGTSPKITAEVAKALQLTMSPEEIAAQVKVTFAPGTLLLQFTATHPSDVIAQGLAGETARQLAREVSELELPRPGLPPWVRLLPVTDGSGAVASVAPVSKYGAAGLAVGVLLGCAAAFVLIRLRPRVATAGELGDDLGVPVVRAENGVAVRDTVAAAAGAASAGTGVSILVSAVDGDAWPMAQTLAEDLADTDSAVLLIDCRAVGPASAASASAGDASGGAEPSLRAALAAGVDGAQSVSRTLAPEAGTVAVLPSGARSGDAADSTVSDRLLSPRAHDVVRTLGAGFDYVILGGVPAESPARLDERVRLVVARLGTRSPDGYRRALGMNEPSRAGHTVVAAKSNPWWQRLPIGTKE
ncbi:hypothetical protein GCM10009551_092740 [Nocardiopsis tropica]